MTIIITADQLVQLGATKDNAVKYVEHLNNAMSVYDINYNKERVCHFLSQIYVESGCLKTVRESLNYSEEGLYKTFRKYFPTLESTKGYGRTATTPANQKAIANKVYGGRMGNKAINDDGWLYKGHGLKQITGFFNHKKCGEALGLDLINKPELLEEPKYAALSAGWFWNVNNLNNLADKGVNMVKLITAKVNGGENGLLDRQAYYTKAKSIF